ncbi:acetyltransferase [Kwoniella heveanensis BCC8398]|uniref:Acetyltransferase n=1 Tax=Kwoniella heveanensis BCC8398 TaxID=1296120 RepID=A0A1B9GTA4_9TREE|nr:acetyltransferase [Kwoniella heveanensis BCC8398]
MTATYSTAGTVSAPIDLSSLKGEFTSLDLSSSASSKKEVKPKVKVTLTSLTVNNAGTLRRINSVVIPIVYSDKFYKEVRDPLLDDVNKLIYYADIPVGAICCRFENLAKSSKEPATLVILTLAILAPYRSLNLGTSLLLSTLRASLHPTTPPPPVPSDKQTNTRSSLVAVPPRVKVNRALAHVQVGNEDAKRFYERLGFKQVGVEENYYSKAEPKGAMIMVLEDIASALGEQPNGNGNGKGEGSS